MIEVDSAERACRLLIDSYARALRGDGRVDWSDIDEAYMVACRALGVRLGESGSERDAETHMRTPDRDNNLDTEKLRELASWYREFADRAGSRDISRSRLRMAEDLEREACLLEQKHALL